MKFLSRFVTPSGYTGYNINDDGVECAILERALYISSYLEDMTKEGYKILNYHGDIIQPDGVSIKDIEVGVFTGTQDELLQLEEEAETALSEQAASKYFDRSIDTKTKVSFRPCLEGVDTIKTREELIKYLEQEETKRKYRFPRDFRPLNSFVEESALFSLDELSTNEDLRKYFTLICNRRKFDSYNDYANLIRFLQNEGVLEETYTRDDVVRAYASWGICGIKDRVVSMDIKTDVASSIHLWDEDPQVTGVPVKSLSKSGLLDRELNFYYCNQVVNLRDIDNNDTGLTNIKPESESMLINLRNTRHDWPSDYVPFSILADDTRFRYYYKLVSESGVTYYIRMDKDNVCVFTRGLFLFSGGFISVRSGSGNYIPLDKCYDYDTYHHWNLLYEKARDLYKKNTVSPMYSNSVDLCLEEGVGPLATISYLARCDVEANADSDGFRDDGTPIVNCINAPAYIIGLNDIKSCINYLNPERVEYSSMEELVDIMSDTRDKLLDEKEYLNGNGKDIDYMRRHRPFEKLQYIMDCKGKSVSVNNLAVGQRADGHAECGRIAGILETIINLENSGLTFESALQNIENNAIIPIEQVVPYRDNTYFGCISDIALLDATRIKQSTKQVFVTKVFREYSNCPIEEQRHYAMEVIVMDTRAKSRGDALLDEVINYVANAAKVALPDLVDGDGYLYKPMYDKCVTLAVRLIYGILLGNMKGTYSNGNYIYNVRGSLIDDFEFDVTIPGSIESLISWDSNDIFYIQLCTLSDYCQREYDFDWGDSMMTGNGVFHYNCVNAKINPWYVTPKDGFTIYSYNFPINYYTYSGEGGGWGETIEDAERVGGLIGYFMDECHLGDAYLIPGLYGRSIWDTELGDVNPLDVREFELMSEYASRFDSESARISDDYPGYHLTRIPLRSDIIFKELASFYGVDPVLESEYVANDENYSGNTAVFTVEPKLLESGVSNVKAIEGGNRISSFSLADEDFDNIISWRELLDNTFTPTRMVTKQGVNIIVEGAGESSKYSLRTMSIEDALKLTQMGVFYRLGERSFYIRTLVSDIKLEVL